MKKILIIVCLVLLTGCSSAIGDATTKVENSLSGLYNIERLEVVVEKGDYHSNTIRKMKADEMEFYFISYSIGNGLGGDTYIYTSILSSVYEKYENKIKDLSLKYGIDLKYNFTTDKYADEDYFQNCPICKGHFITMNVSSSKSNDLLKFVDEVVNIKEINELYKIWLERENNNSKDYFVFDYSEIFFDDDKSSDYSIFKYYFENHK